MSTDGLSFTNRWRVTGLGEVLTGVGDAVVTIGLTGTDDEVELVGADVKHIESPNGGTETSGGLVVTDHRRGEASRRGADEVLVKAAFLGGDEEIADEARRR